MCMMEEIVKEEHMQIDKMNRVQLVIDKLEKAKEFLALSTMSEDEMEMLALGYLERSYQDIFNIKEDICDND